MTRRAALAVLGMTGVFMENRKEQSGISTGGMLNWTTKPSSLTFDLNAFTQYHFILDGEHVVFTPAELMAALKEKP